MNNGQFNDNALRGRIIKEAFGKRKPSKKEYEGAKTVLEYLWGKSIYELADTDSVDYAPFMEILDNILAEQWATSLREVMGASRTETNSMLRTFCWDAFKKTYPTASIKRLAGAFGNTRARPTIQLMLTRLPDYLKYDKHAALQYKKFSSALEQKLNPNTKNNQ